jgi:hypothetical protein
MVGFQKKGLSGAGVDRGWILTNEVKWYFRMLSFHTDTLHVF